MQRTSFPLYIAVILLFIFGLYSGYVSFVTGEKTADFLTRSVDAIMQIVNFTMFSVIAFALAKSVDAVHFRKAYMLRTYFLSIVYAAIIWLILDSGRNVFIGVADLNLFLIVVIFSFFIALLAYYASGVFDVRRKITKLLVGLPVYNKEGKAVPADKVKIDGGIVLTADLTKEHTTGIIAYRAKKNCQLQTANYRPIYAICHFSNSHNFIFLRPLSRRQKGN